MKNVVLFDNLISEDFVPLKQCCLWKIEQYKDYFFEVDVNLVLFKGNIR